MPSKAIKSPRALRNIQSEYYWKDELLKVNMAADPNRAVLHAVDHLQHNDYKADKCIIYGQGDAILHAILGRSPATGAIKILFEREVKQKY